MGLFKREKGDIEQPVRIHFRRLRHWHGPNAKHIAHWALQVGDYFYELAAPADDIAAIGDEECLSKDDGEQEEDEEGNEEDDNEADGESNREYENDTYAECIEPCVVHRGRFVPLQISRGGGWSDLPMTKTFTLQAPIRLKPEIVRSRAIHIFNAVFRDRYDFWYYNCQAFVCYLLFSIVHLEYQDRIKFPYGYGQRHWVASFCIYQIWKAALGEKMEIPNNFNPKQGLMREKYHEYAKIIPPRKMKELLEPEQRPPRARTQLPHSSRHTEPRSHAGHMTQQWHHDMRITMQDALNSAAQMPALQMATQTGAFGGNPGSFGPIPGAGFGF